MVTKITRDIDIAVKQLQEGNVIALPTETVYGLAANALNADAVLKIFETKERPRFNPLIVHIHKHEEIEKYVSEIPQAALRIFDAFSPGPITIIFRKEEIIPDIVTAGLGTVALRIPAHETFRKILEEAGLPAAAPSANRSGRISPTSAEDVLAELNDKIEYIFDGGKSEVGIESTVVTIQGDDVLILRPGFITKEDLEEVTPNVFYGMNKMIDSPGQMKFHYEPVTPLYIADDKIELNSRMGVLDPEEFTDLKDMAMNLYSELRKLDEGGFDTLITWKVKPDGLGRAINDRLEKAARGYIINDEEGLRIKIK